MGTGAELGGKIIPPCTCSNECTCDATFCGPCLTPDTEEYTQAGRKHIRNTRLYKCLPQWFTCLTIMHAFFCDMANCTGIPPLDQLADDNLFVEPENCIYACESIWCLKGILYGFRIPFIDESPPPIPNSQYEGGELDPHISKDVKEEYKAGWLHLITKSSWITPIFGVVQSNKVRVVKDFSTPTGAAINDYITYFRTTYMNVRSALSSMSPRCYFGLIDIASAFRSIPCHPTHTKYMVYSWFKRLFCDWRFPFGLRCSPEIFCRITALVRLIMLSKGIDVFIYVDDFFFIHKTYTGCMHTFNTLLDLLHSLGFETKENKCIKPAQTMKWLGIWFYSNWKNKGIMQLRMDPPRLQSLKDTLRGIIRHKQVTYKTLEKLIGKLVFLSMTIYGAKMFYRNMLYLLHKKLKKTGRTHLSDRELKFFLIDAKFWLYEATQFDGTALIPEAPCISGEYMATDACIEPHMGTPTMIGIGYFVEGQIMSITASTAASLHLQLWEKGNETHRKHKKMFPCNSHNPSSWNIAYLELYTIWWLIADMPERLQNKYVPIRIDNTNNLAWIINETAPIQYLPILRPMISLMRQYNIKLYPVWVKSEANILADAASRADWETIARILPTWREEVAETLYIPLSTYSKPGPLFLFKHGYYDREVPGAWETELAEVTHEHSD